jgi:quinolinate synthase
MNSAAALKAFCGKNGGIVCTSSNARQVISWALERGKKILFFPDQHLGRNTAVAMGYGLEDTVVWTPAKYLGGNDAAQLEQATFILWRGHCSVHGRFSADVVDELRRTRPGIRVIVHPECTHEVVTRADLVGSTEFIIKTIEAAPAGSSWAVGTELNLVQRLAREHPEQEIAFLDRFVCYCSTMNRIDLPHLVWTLESLADGVVVNRISVDPETERHAQVALQRMLDLPGTSHRD